ncbi:hypothetical protein C8Q75DRAFT_803827 [Abortiporus biennis]|nr:hypothetical protein C8Q75DRAFT_803827 [Abortiporus biennis]
MPELKLVYRALRKISDWTVHGFYSNVYIEGEENVPKEGPLIIASSHHNEIIDIATLSITIPHRRPVCFWAKSTMFKNPPVKQILLSSGSIPVRRNPNSNNTPTQTNDNGGNGGKMSTSAVETQQSLFAATFRALDRGEVIGVFPEGTSYTEPEIAQIKDGASWVALEYARWQEQHGMEKKDNEGQKKPVRLIPVGIVYTDKSRFQSRVCVRWGSPIDLESLTEKYLSEGTDDPRSVIKRVTQEIDRSLRALTINASDWDTLHVALTARDIVWNDSENIPLDHYVEISQSFIDMLSRPDIVDSPILPTAKASLLKYHSLLHYTGVSHSYLIHLYPYTSKTQPIPTIGSASSVFIRQLALTLLHPRFIFFLPPFLVAIPGYISGYIARRILGSRNEQETLAQFKGVFGGIAFGLTSWCAGKGLVNLLKTSSRRGLQKAAHLLFGDGVGIRNAIGVLVMMYGTTWMFFAWHKALVASNYRQCKHLLTSAKVLLSLLFRPASGLTHAEIESHSRPPPVPTNPFIKRRNDPNTQSDAKVEPVKRLGIRSILLIHEVFKAKLDAITAVDELMRLT